MTRKQGKIIGVGLGPGAADLMSVRADKAVRSAKIIAFFRKKGASGRARQIISEMLLPSVQEIVMEYPVTTEIPVSDPRYNEMLSEFYEECTNQLYQLTLAGHDVVILCEGDPFFYGSFMHLHSRLQPLCEVETIAGITGMSAAWTATNMPITWGDDVLVVLMGTMAEEEICARLAVADAVVIMKIGRHLPKIRKALKSAQMDRRALVVGYAAMVQQPVTPLSEYTEETLPYFSIIIVHGRGRRP